MDVKTENTDGSNVNDSPEVPVNVSFETIQYALRFLKLIICN